MQQQQYLIRDLTGRGAVVKHNKTNALRFFASDFKNDGISLSEWINSAQIGDTIACRTIKITKIK